MIDEHSPDARGDLPKPRARTLGIRIALVAAGAAAGVVTATAIGADAATTNGSGSTIATSDTAAVSSSASGGSSGPATLPAGAPADRHGGPRGDEKAVDATTAAKLKAAALKAVPGGTVDRVETDSGDATYEVHMTKSDGSRVTVKFGKDLAVAGVEAGMGK